MDNEQLENETPEPREEYVPRPWWQVWGARIGLVLFIMIVILSYIMIARGDF